MNWWQEFLEPLKMSEEEADGLWQVTKIMIAGIIIMLGFMVYYYIFGW